MTEPEPTTDAPAPPAAGEGVPGPDVVLADDIPAETAGRWLIAIVILACVLRLTMLGSRSLRRDEAWPVNTALSGGWGEICRVVRAKPMPPGYAGLVKVMHAVGGRTDWWLRLMPAASGIAAVLLLYFVGKRLADRRLGLLAAACLAVSPRHLYHSRDLKQYAFAALVGVLLVLLALIIRERKSLRWWAAWTLVAGASPWIAYSSAMAVGATSALLFIFLVRDRDFRSLAWWLGANVVVGGCVIVLYDLDTPPAQKPEGIEAAPGSRPSED